MLDNNYNTEQTKEESYSMLMLYINISMTAQFNLKFHSNFF